MNQDKKRIYERKEKGKRKTMDGLGKVNLGLLVLGKLICWQPDKKSAGPSDLEQALNHVFDDCIEHNNFISLQMWGKLTFSVWHTHVVGHLFGAPAYLFC